MKSMKEKKKKDNSANILLALAAVLVLGLIAWVSTQVTDRSDPDSIQQSTQLATLSPTLFTGKTRDAYQAAKDVPEVLAQVPCYCGCMQNNGHQHNLHCFIDEHAVG